MKMSVSILMIFYALLLTTCGGSVESEVDGYLTDTLTIGIRCTIGSDVLNTEYGFAEVAAIAHAPDSSLLVVDPRFANVRRFSPSGELLVQYGSKGEGPGELNEPWDVAVSAEGIVYISDMRGLNAYSLETGEWLTIDQRYGRPMLLKMLGNRDSSFTALYGSYNLSGEYPLRIATYLLFSWTSPTGICFWSDTSRADRSDSDYLRLCFTQPVVATDAEGNVYVSQSTPSELLIHKYSPTGELLTSIQGDFDAVPLTQEEKTREIEYYKYYSNTLGMSIDYIPQDEWCAVSELGVDGNGMIWARVGGKEPPLYRIYDQQGSLVCLVQVEGVPVQGRYLSVRISPWGIAAYPFDPAQEEIQVYLLDAPEWAELWR